MPAQWEMADPATHDYAADRWDFAQDGYLQVFVHRTIRFVCEHCERSYQHYFVSHADWLKVPAELRSKRLCVDCYAQVR